MNLIDKYLQKLQPISGVLSGVAKNAVRPALPMIDAVDAAARFYRTPQGQQYATSAGKQLATTVTEGVPAALRLSPGYRAAQNVTQMVPQLQAQRKYFPAQTPQDKLGDALKAGRLALTAGGVRGLNPQTLIASAGFGGGAAQLTGGNFFEGAGQGVATAPTLGAVGKLTNPLVSKYAAMLVPKGSGEATRFIANRLATGALNVPEGAVMNTALGQQPLTPTSAGIDFLTGVATGSTVSRGGKPKITVKGNIYRAPHVDDARFLDEAVDVLRTNKKDLGARIKATSDIDRLMNDYIKERLPANEYAKLYDGHIDKKIKVLQEFFRTAEDQFDIPKLGVVAEQPEKKYAFNLNKERLDLSSSGKQALDQAVETFRPELEAARGKPLSHKEVVEAAETADVLQKTVSRDATLKAEAALLKTRQAVAAGANGEGLTRDFVDNMRILSSHAADAGRRLGSFRIQGEALQQSTKEQVIRQLTKLGHDTEALVKAGEGVDWNDQRQVVEYYRKFVKPSFGEIMSEYRYMNLLSSPKTQIVNVFSNAIQAGIVRPSTKLASGLIDPVASALTGSARENYVREVPLYYRGMFSAIPGALQKVRDVYTGKAAATNLDFNRLPSNTILSKGNIVTKTMEGMDQFFRTIIEGGEKEAFRYKFGRQGREVRDLDIDQLAKQAGEYSTFRQGLKSEGQGAVLDWIDKGTEAVMGMRRVPGVSWFIPFVQTPMNILKQGIEYSPAGVATMVGADNKREQLAKSLVGSSVFLGAGYLAMQDRLTWATPKDKAQRDAFYAAGMQPYSVKIGDKWYGFSKLGPLAYPLALAAGIKYAYKDNPAAAAQGMDEQTLSALTGIMGFFADQSYMQGIGDMVKAAEGREGFDVSKVVSNVATQYIPASSFLRWTAQIIDPIYRKGEGVGGNIAKGLPFLSETQPAYENPLGEPSERQFPLTNAFSPVSLTEEQPDFKSLYNMRSEELRQNALIKAEEKRLEAEISQPVSANTAQAAEGGDTQDALLATKRAELQEKLARKRVDIKGGVEEVGGKLFYKNDVGEVTILNLGQFDTPAEGIAKFKQDKDKIAMARKVYEIKGLPETRKAQIYQKLGVSKDDAEYDYLANQANDIKAQYLFSQLQSSDHQKVLATLYAGRQESLGGDRYVSDGTLDYLEEAGLISKAENKALTKIKLGKDGTPAAGTIRSGSAKKKIKAVELHVPKARKISIPKPKRTRVKRYKLSQYKLKKVKKLSA